MNFPINIFTRLAPAAATLAMLCNLAAPAAARSKEIPFEAAGFTAQERDCLALAIYYEARSESDAGQEAVAQVVLNRVRDRAYPDDVCSVVFQGSERRTGCQFSFTCDGSMARLPQGRAWTKAREVAAAAIEGSANSQVEDATHYHTTAIQPYWSSSLTKVAIIGAHIFYSKSAPVRSARSPLFERIEQVILSAAAADASAKAVQPATVTVHRGGGNGSAR